jgi:hypothetical protein
MAIAVNGLYTPNFFYSLGPGPGNNTATTASYNQAAGNLIVVAVSSYGSPNDGAPWTVTDAAGNTYVAGTRFDPGINRAVQFFWAKNCLGNVINQITVNATLASGGFAFFISICAWDISGAALVTPNCGEAMGWQAAPVTSPIATGAGAGSSNLTTTKANAIILAFGTQNDYGAPIGTRTAQTSPAYTLDGVDWSAFYDALIYEHLVVAAIQSGVSVNFNTTDTASSGIIVVEAFASATQPSVGGPIELMMMGCGDPR